MQTTFSPFHKLLCLTKCSSTYWTHRTGTISTANTTTDALQLPTSGFFSLWVSYCEEGDRVQPLIWWWLLLFHILPPKKQRPKIKNMKFYRYKWFLFQNRATLEDIVMWRGSERQCLLPLVLLARPEPPTSAVSTRGEEKDAVTLTLYDRTRKRKQAAATKWSQTKLKVLWIQKIIRKRSIWEWKSIREI